jgi:teichuronic acid biosynthesis glycosyltransferase TuaH
VGPVAEPEHLQPLRAAPNIEFHPPLSRPEVAGLIRSADVGLVPHVPTPLTATMSPLKVFEYLAGGLPVAAVDLPPMRGIDDRVMLARDGDGFLDAVRSALALGRAPEGQRQAFVSANSWAARHDRLLDLAFGEEGEHALAGARAA